MTSDAPGAGHDPFDTLGLAPRFDLTAAEVERAFLQRSALSHPDRAGAPGAQTASAQLSAAKRMLIDPEARAGALLARLHRRSGVPTRPADERALPEGFLMEIMALREQAEGARSAGDDAALARAVEGAQARREAHIARAGELLAGASDDPTPANLRACRLELNAWRYIERMLSQLDTEGLA
jgi:molecular chaperone HscB